MEKEYYTPSIWELYVGFECENRNKDEFGQWMNFSPTIITRGDLTYLGQYKDWINRYRVKYLNKEDIEELGFEYDVNGSGEEIPKLYKEHGESGAYNLDKQLEPSKTCWIIYHFPDNFLIIERIVDCSQGRDDMLFRGYIKNKSELVKLLKQLGIE